MQKRSKDSTTLFESLFLEDEIMQIFTRLVRRVVFRVVEKTISVFVIAALLFQPMGTVGMYGAFSFSRGVVVASDELGVGEEQEQEIEVSSEATEEGDASDEEQTAQELKEELVTEEVLESEETAVETEGAAEVVIAPQAVTAETESSKDLDEEAGEEGDLLPDTQVEGPSESEGVVTDEEGVAADEASTEEEMITVDETPIEEEEDGEVSLWKRDGKKATTSQKVVLDETYVAPQNDEVTVTFTKLPEDSGTLSIEEVKLSDEQVAELNAFSHTAYDITSSMEDGAFEYVLTLPTPKDKKEVQVKYAEDVDELEAAKTVDKDDVEQKKASVAVTLDHFTVFIATYGDAAFSVDKSEFIPEETIYLKATGLNDTKYYRLALDPPSGPEIFTTTCFNPGEGVTELTDSYTFLTDAVLGNWGAELKEYTASNCTGGHDDISDPFILVAPEEQQHVEVTFCHATPPDTAANGYEQITTDDDGIMQQGHASQHSADIIPPFSVGEIEFPGQNWAPLGQAIWNNDCQAVGTLKAVKVVDDQSDLTAWSFQLDQDTPIQADASGEVDFGYVSVGVHTITEIGVASYSVTNISGERCEFLEATSQAGATVVANSTTTCTFSNAVDKGSITIVKDALPDDPQDFVFSVTNMEGNEFTLDDDGDNGNDFSNSITFSSLWPGEYSFTEGAVEGWELTGMNCVSSNMSLDMPVSATADITLHPGENVTCTYINTKITEEEVPICGDGIVNQETEQCDGTDGVTEGENFCTFSCVLVPVYEAGGSCSEGTEKVQVGSYFVSGTEDPDGISIPLVAGKEYVLEATGDYSYGGVATNHELNRADAGYSSDDNFAGPNLLNSLFGIAPGAFYRGVHALISDLGTGTFGVVDWGAYDASHVYPMSVTPNVDTDIRFMISDWYDEWYTGDWLSEPNKNQQGYRDNEGGLTVNVYECQPPVGSITVMKDAQPDHEQDFGYVLNPGFEEFVLDDDADSLFSNMQTFADLPAGEYTVTEGLVSGWELESVTCTSNQRSLLPTTEPIRTIDLQPGEHVGCTFTNVAKNSSLTIIKDAVPDSAQDFGYAMNGAGFVEFVLDDDTDPLLSNTASFTSLPAGEYTVTEGLVPGWALSGVSCVSNFESVSVTTEPIRSLSLEPGEAMICTFTNIQTASVPVCGDGILNQESEQCDGTDGVTEGENFCTFSCQLIPLYQGGGVCSEGTEPVLVDTKFVESFMTDDIIPDPVTISLTGGKEYVVESVGHFGYGGVPHNNSLNRADAGYATDTNWVGVNLDTLFGSASTALYRGIHMLISDFGTGTFGVVDWGGYNPAHVYTKNFAPASDTNVQFAISDWYDTWYAGDELSNFNKNQFGFRDNDGGLTLNIYECQGGEQESPRLLLTKSNDSVGDETPGNEVVYSLTVTALGGDVNDVTLTDLPPEGFEYVGGSGEGAPFIHEYASPGVWDFGDMEEGESKTVTYKTKISGSQDAGLYKDLAFARGTSVGGANVLANGADNPFVGTEVKVVLNDTPTVVLDEDTEEEKERKTKTVTRYVLGATLPLTGTDGKLVVGAIALLVAGVGFLVFARRRKSTVVGMLFLGMISFGMPAVAEGATLSTKIETPEAVMTTQNFKIGFATLDVLGRNLEVECYTTLSATPFAEYSLESSFGGNAGDCQVNSSVVPTDGNYEFFIRVNALGESPETVESEHVTVTVATDVPGIPTNYDRDDDNCQAFIVFTTANDGGKTVKVELYRSTSNPFVANGLTKVTEQMIGSNTNGSFITSLLSCDEDIFYAIRAVAGNGNGSGFVGDVDVDTETTTSTRTRINTVTIPGQITSALPVVSTGGEGVVEGVSTETPAEGEGTVLGDEPDVLGEMTEVVEAKSAQGWDVLRTHPWRSFFGVVLLLLLIRYGYHAYTTHSRREL